MRALGSRLCAAFALTAAMVIPAARAEDASGEAAPSHPVVEVASFGAAPVTAVDGEALQPNDGDIVYRPAARGSTPEAERETDMRALSGETWPELLRRAGEKANADLAMSPAAAGQIDLLPPLEPGKYLRLRWGPADPNLHVDYVIDARDAYSILLNRAGVEVRRQASDPRLVEKMRSDASKASLFTAADAIGLPEGVVLKIADIFADDVDFFRELRDGYRCTVAYEMLYREGHIDGVGRVLAAEFQVRDRRFQAYFFDDGQGRSGYYTETGKSLKKAFRKSPVEFSRITSEYTTARFHPVLGLWRAHLGTDYAAPEGSKVLAAADGVVGFMGPHGELGNLVILKHFGKYETYYGHLEKFAPDLAVGSAVKKGEVIGYVGMTGLATGPHVHYELRIDDASGQWVSIPLPEKLEEPPIQSDAFFKAVRHYRGMFQAAQKTHFVILD